MSLQALDHIMARLVLDRSFRELVRSNPEALLDQYDLTPEERARLLKLRRPNTAPAGQN